MFCVNCAILTANYEQKSMFTGYENSVNNSIQMHFYNKLFQFQIEQMFGAMCHDY